MRLKKILSWFLPFSATFFVVAGWNWYHFPHRPHPRFVIVSLISWLVLNVFYWVAKRGYLFLVKKFGRHVFWQTNFINFIDKIFWISSWLFLAFFINNEWISLLYVAVILLALFLFSQKVLKQHPVAEGWLYANQAIWALAFGIFVITGLCQFLAYHYYILDVQAKFSGIVLFRTFSITMFWLLGVAVAGLVYWHTERKWRYILLVVWNLFFVSSLILWMFNVGVLYFSGLYLDPVLLEHIKGSSAVVWNRSTLWFAVSAAVILAGFVWVEIFWWRRQKLATRRHWNYYNAVIIILALGFIFGLASTKTTPEYVVARAFYEYFTKTEQKIILDPIIQKKLERFGLKYNLDEFYVSQKEQIFNTSTANLLSEKFVQKKPNVVIIFLESFSSRLTSVYNPSLKNITPGLEKMAVDKNTTIFKKYFNASTPTVTGLLSQLCSFLPPTGHEEIETDKKMQRHHLLCLPQVLKENAGYKYNAYITAVEKDFANKDTLFASMGVDEVLGTEELAKYINSQPLSWGYSDHQMFPVLEKFMTEKSDPFLLMLSTVDTHPPFNLSKDMINYGDGKNDVLNSFHTTDDAFGQFWDWFRGSDFYNNTIVVAVADHAIFPTALDKTFPEVYKQLNFYDENTFLLYTPQSLLPKEVGVYSSGIDFAPTLLELLNVNVANSFEGHSIFSGRKSYPNILGMHEFGLFINEVSAQNLRLTKYTVPSNLKCNESNFTNDPEQPLSLCEFLQYYKWKRQMFEQGRLWNLSK